MGLRRNEECMGVIGWKGKERAVGWFISAGFFFGFFLSKINHFTLKS